MGTESLIFYEKSPGVFHGVSCNHDGYLTGVGAILYKHYHDFSKIEKLISLGSISSLDKECEVAPRYTPMNSYLNKDQYHLGYTVAYNRDLGHQMTETIICNDVNQIVKSTKSAYISYIYLWQDNKWNTYSQEDKKWVSLEDALIKLATDNERDPGYYTYLPKTVELDFSCEEYKMHIARGFLIVNGNTFKYSRSDFIKFKAQDKMGKYELLLKVIDVVQHEGIKDGYQLLLMSNPHKDFVWFEPMRYV